MSEVEISRERLVAEARERLANNVWGRILIQELDRRIEIDRVQHRLISQCNARSLQLEVDARRLRQALTDDPAAAE